MRSESACVANNIVLLEPEWAFLVFVICRPADFQWVLPTQLNNRAKCSGVCVTVRSIKSNCILPANLSRVIQKRFSRVRNVSPLNRSGSLRQCGGRIKLEMHEREDGLGDGTPLSQFTEWAVELGYLCQAG
jgi:hypothetical protein